jgi:hypothetical protein
MAILSIISSIPRVPNNGKILSKKLNSDLPNIRKIPVRHLSKEEVAYLIIRGAIIMHRNQRHNLIYGDIDDSVDNITIEDKMAMLIAMMS